MAGGIGLLEQLSIITHQGKKLFIMESSVRRSSLVVLGGATKHTGENLISLLCNNSPTQEAEQALV